MSGNKYFHISFFPSPLWNFGGRTSKLSLSVKFKANIFLLAQWLCFTPGTHASFIPSRMYAVQCVAVHKFLNASVDSKLRSVLVRGLHRKGPVLALDYLHTVTVKA